MSTIPYPEYFGQHIDGRASVSDLLDCLVRGTCRESAVVQDDPDPMPTGLSDPHDAAVLNGTKAPFYVFERSFLSFIAPELMEEFPKVLCAGHCRRSATAL